MEENKIESTQTNNEVKVDASSTAPNASKPGFRKGGFQQNGNNRGGKKFYGRGGKGFRRDQPKEYEERVVQINRVTKVVKGGKRMKFSALVVIGNKKGKYGFGMGKSGEVPDAIKKSVEKAKRNTFVIHMVKGNTIAHEVIGNFGATRVFLKPAPEGTGIIAGGPVRAILELSGIQNVYSKVYGSRTAINIIRATNAALSSLKDYKEVQALRKGGSSDVK